MFSQSTMDGKFGELHELTMELSRYVHDAAREPTAAHVVEKEIWARVLKIGGQAFGHFLTEQGDGDVGETFTMPEGRVLKRLDLLHVRPYQSIFGAYELKRAVYGTREGQTIEWVPLDQRLQLPESGYSYVLQDWDQALGVEHAFSRIDETIRMILGFQQPVDSLERMNRQMARTVESFRTSRPQPPAEEEGEIVVVTADNKGIPMRRPADPRRSPQTANAISQLVVNVARPEHGFVLRRPVPLSQPTPDSALAIDQLFASTLAHSKCLLASKGCSF